MCQKNVLRRDFQMILDMSRETKLGKIALIFEFDVERGHLYPVVDATNSNDNDNESTTKLQTPNNKRSVEHGLHYTVDGLGGNISCARSVVCPERRPPFSMFAFAASLMSVINSQNIENSRGLNTPAVDSVRESYVFLYSLGRLRTVLVLRVPSFLPFDPPLSERTLLETPRGWFRGFLAPPTRDGISPSLCPQNIECSLPPL